MMNRDEPNPASAKEQAEGSPENVNVGPSDDRVNKDDDFNQDELDGKTDSGPEPDVFGREIPPQNNR
jgi:hypothetical protein